MSNYVCFKEQLHAFVHAKKESMTIWTRRAGAPIVYTLTKTKQRGVLWVDARVVGSVYASSKKMYLSEIDSLFHALAPTMAM